MRWKQMLLPPGCNVGLMVLLPKVGLVRLQPCTTALCLYRTTESLRLETTSKIIESNHDLTILLQL